jgi:alkylation response protein AidB-like acyl-CoA dehydrogenase
MDFNFTEEQELLRETLERFCRDHYGFDQRRQLLKAKADHWAALAELGILALPFAEEDGGFGGSMVDVMLVMEAFGKALVIEPYVANIVLSGGILKRVVDPARRRALLEPLMVGRMRIALAHAESSNRFSLDTLAATARRVDGGFALNGEKIAVLDGARADGFIVSAVVEGAGPTLFFVRADASGLTRCGYEGVDGYGAANLSLDGVQLGVDSLLSAEGEGLALLEPAVDEGIVAIAAEAVGAMAFVNETTVDYTKTRKQFDVPIASFQVLQHLMVDMFIEREQTVSLLYKAAVLSARGGWEAAMAASALKVQLARASRFIGQQAVQLHGGMGIADESAVAHYFKRLSVISQQFGDADFHALRYARLDRQGGEYNQRNA